ncbi:hypothetical protein V8F20_003941 [Naviculisporaceae sp. PSN 640]
MTQPGGQLLTFGVCTHCLRCSLAANRFCHGTTSDPGVPVTSVPRGYKTLGTPPYEKVECRFSNQTSSHILQSQSPVTNLLRLHILLAIFFDKSISTHQFGFDLDLPTVTGIWLASPKTRPEPNLVIFHPPPHFPPTTSKERKKNPSTMATQEKASTCCGKSAECVCAKQATCSCGKQSALHCTCDKATTENSVSGPRCSCRARPAGECTCERAATENTNPIAVGVTACACGVRPADACTCEKAADGKFNPSEHETDFTTQKVRGMATISSSLELTGGGVTWEEGILWRVSEILFGDSGMALELWGAAAASTSVGAATVFKNAKNIKNGQRSQSPVGPRINSTSPPPLSATLDTDSGTVTISTTSGSSQVGGGQDDWHEERLGHFLTAATHPFVQFALLFYSMFLVFKLLFRLTRIAWRHGIWFPCVFFMELWRIVHPTSEEPPRTSITNKGIGGIILETPKSYAEGKVAGSRRSRPKKAGPGGMGKKLKAILKPIWKIAMDQHAIVNPVFWKFVINQKADLKLTFRAINAFVRHILGTVVEWVLWVDKLVIASGTDESPRREQQPPDPEAATVVGDDKETGGNSTGLDNEGGLKTGEGNETPKEENKPANKPANTNNNRNNKKNKKNNKKNRKK